jgi:hypothetical protein
MNGNCNDNGNCFGADTRGHGAENSADVLRWQ